MAAKNQEQNLPLPGSDAPPEEIFDYPFLLDKPTIDYLNGHGRVMFVIRGPPGTGKETLSDMIMSKYPESELFSAKDYFNLPLAMSRGKIGGNVSHEWCYKKTVKACKADTKIIIVRNTNVRKWEIETYLQLSRDYGYTVIIADASKKFHFNAEILGKTNAQGLTPEYFQSRLRQWVEIVPWYTGWFLNPADSLWLENEATKLLSDLMKLPQYTDDFNFFSDADFDKYYKDEKELFCIAGFCSCQKSGETHYLHKKVQDEIGKVSILTLRAFIFSSEIVTAVVSLTPEQYAISRTGETESHSFSKMFQNLGIQDDRKPQNVMATKFSMKSQQTIRAEDQGCDDLPITQLSYIVIKSHSKKSFPYIKDIDMYSMEVFSTLKEQSSVPSDDFLFSVNDSKVCQLKQKEWLVFLSKKYTMQSVITGLYL